MRSWQLCTVNRAEHSPQNTHDNCFNITCTGALETITGVVTRFFFVVCLIFYFTLRLKSSQHLSPDEFQRSVEGGGDRVSTAKMKSVSVGTESEYQTDLVKRGKIVYTALKKEKENSIH